MATATPPRDFALADPVILVDDDGREIGTADRMTIHTAETPLHRAFSSYLFNARGEVLITRRALSKKTWPGVWTNSCCGHPKPGESDEEAVRRRISEELGLRVGPVMPLLPDFRYRAQDASGIVENEVCPVYGAFVIDEIPDVDPGEVAEWAWVPWDALVAAVSATPHVYSPWAALQVCQLPAVLPLSRTGGRPDVSAFIAEVDRLLVESLDGLAADWESFAGGAGLDVLDEDLPETLRHLLVGRGKRLRVQMAYWGFLAGGGREAGPAYGALVRVAAALESLHLFALVQDDVMDESASRRGEAALHRHAANLHARREGRGPSARFGESIAILLGDLAHTLGDRLADGLPAPLRQAWYRLCIELVAGQRADLTGAAAGRRDLAHARHVATVKSGRYSIRRPLELGALVAGASDDVLEALGRYGDHLGRAFALRDDLLGVWGDPEITGKPAGDDLLEGKPTMLLALAAERLDGDAAALLDQVGRE